MSDQVQMQARATFIDRETDRPIRATWVFETDPETAAGLEDAGIAVRLDVGVPKARVRARPTAPGWFDVVSWRGERYNQTALREGEAASMADFINKRGN